MLRLSTELTCCDSLILVLSEGGWGCESETYLVCAYLFTYSVFLARRNQPQPAASAMDQIPPLMMEWIQEDTTFSPQDFCGAAGTNFTGKSIFRSKTAPSRCCRALTRNSSQRCWDRGWCTGTTGAGAAPGIRSKSADGKWGRHGWATLGGV